MKKLIYLFVFAFALVLASCSKESAGVNNVESTSSVLSGSYATILVIGNYLYGVNSTELHTLDISDNQHPVSVDVQDVGFDIENLYYDKGVLYLGSSQNMYIYEINSKGIPVWKSNTLYNFNAEIWCSHDPVIVRDNYAYVSLSANIQGPCGGSRIVNELRIYDVSNIEQPSLVSITPLSFPKGLALMDNYLFVCLEHEGIVLLDITNKDNPAMKWSDYSFSDAYDLILNEDLLIVVSKNKLIQYDVSDVNNITWLSNVNL